MEEKLRRAEDSCSALEDSTLPQVEKMPVRKVAPSLRRLNVKISSPSDALSPCSQKLMAADIVNGYILV